MSTDSKYFSSTKKGEIHELKTDLNSLKEETKKEAVKKVIALMTVGKDVSRLFTDVLKCITTSNLELKKLVYLYLMNYAKNNEELAILAVHTFQQDCSDPNPLVRSLALRTMGCLRVEKILEYLCDPLSACLKDPHPYVAKTAAICVAKLYDMDPELVENRGFLDELRSMLSNNNPLVVANAVAALVEIDEVSATPVFVITRSVLGKLVAALEENSEWSQCYILNSLARYTPKDGKEAKTIVDKVIPVLQHSNTAVVMGAVRIVMTYIDHIDNKEYIKVLLQKLGPPLVSMLNREPEVKYVALRNIALILQKRPALLVDDLEVFYCKYDDPLYVKMEKLEIIVTLVNESNIDAVLTEFKEYSQYTDVEFVRKVVRTIGRTAIQIEKSADKCVNLLLDLVKDASENKHAGYVKEESISVLRDIFRRYPQRYQKLVPSLVIEGELLEDPEARASLVWIVGEFLHQLEDPTEVLQSFVDTFTDDDPLVQKQVLTAVVKLFLKQPKDAKAKEMLEQVLQTATEEVENPDIRDRGFIYLRLLTVAHESATKVVLSDRPPIIDTTSAIEEKTLNELISSISTLASVYHKPATHFVPRMKVSEGRSISTTASGSKSANPKRSQKESAGSAPSGNSKTVTTTPAPPPEQSGGGEIDILGLSSGTQSPSPAPIIGWEMGSMGSGGGDNYVVPKPVLHLALPRDNPKCQGLQVETMFALHQEQVKLRLLFTNYSDTPVDSFLVKFNSNIYRAAPSASRLNVPPVAPGGGQGKATIVVVFGEGERGEVSDVQVALKCALGTCFFVVPLNFQTTLLTNGKIDTETFSSKWSNGAETATSTLKNTLGLDLEAIRHRLELNNIFCVGSPKHYSAKVADGSLVLLEVDPLGPQSLRLSVKSEQAYASLVVSAVCEILQLQQQQTALF